MIRDDQKYRFNLTRAERDYFNRQLAPFLESENFRSMRNFRQHGDVSTYDHSLDVARLCYYFNLRLHLGIDSRTLIRGALLHDFYLYEWHDRDSHPRGHAANHPAVALANAEKEFKLNEAERQIILTHMWPFNFLRPPKSRAALLVCVVDKIEATYELAAALPKLLRLA